MSTFPMEITKQGARSLWIKMRNVDLYLKEATVIYSFHPLAAGYPTVALKLQERLDCSHLFNSEHRRKFSTDYSSGER